MKKIILLSLALLGLGLGTAPLTQADVPICTSEAKMCPDGKTWVSRTGPNCQFKECPDSGTACIDLYDPVCGQVKYKKDGKTYYEQKTFGNTCTMNNAGATYISKGECKKAGDIITACPLHDLMVPGEGCKYDFYKDKNGCDIPKLVCDEPNDSWDKIRKSLRVKIDNRLENFQTNLDKRTDDTDLKIKHIEKIIVNLQKAYEETTREKLKLIVRYIIFKLETMIENYEAGGDIDNILDFLN